MLGRLFLLRMESRCRLFEEGPHDHSLAVEAGGFHGQHGS